MLIKSNKKTARQFINNIKKNHLKIETHFVSIHMSAYAKLSQRSQFLITTNEYGYVLHKTHGYINILNHKLDAKLN